MKLCTRHKISAFLFCFMLLLFALLLALDYDSILTTYTITNGVKTTIYTPIGEAILKLLFAMASVTAMWEFAIRYIDKKIAAEPQLQSYRIRRFEINCFFFALSLVGPLACILTFIMS